MASYFVARHARPGAGAVHDRGCCPPGVFPLDEAEYLGEFLDVGQALAVARLRYPQVGPCACCGGKAASAVSAESPGLLSLRR